QGSVNLVHLEQRFVEESCERRDVPEDVEQPGIELWTAGKRCGELTAGDELAMLEIIRRRVILREAAGDPLQPFAVEPPEPSSEARRLDNRPQPLPVGR